MKLHLNLTLRRAVLAAMALVAVHTTQAQDVVPDSPTIASPPTISGGLNYGNQIVNVGNYEGPADYIIADGQYSAYEFYIGGRGFGEKAEYGNNGTLTVDATATLSATDSINVGSTQVTQENGEGIVGTLIVDGGKVTSKELNVGVNKGSGCIKVSGGGKISATDALKMGYFNSDISGSNYIAIDGTGSSLTVGEAGGNNDFTSIGTDTNGSISIGNGASATFYDQTIIGENANSYGYVTVTNQGVLSGAATEATASSTLTLGTKTVLGYKKGAFGSIDVNGSKVTGTEMVVGSAGEGQLSGMDGSTIDLKTLFLGQSEGGKGSLSLINGSKLTVQTDLTIGNEGTGTATLTDATLDVAKNIHIGYLGSGSLTAEGESGITAGGDVVLGGGKGGNGTLSVGKGSKAQIAGNLSVGYDGTGTVTNDGTITAKNATIYGADSSITNSGDLTTGDTIIYLGFLDNSGNTTIDGKLEVSGGSVTNNGTLTAGNTSLTNAILSTGEESTTTINGNLGIFGGTTTLSGQTTVTGDTAITAQGTLTTTAGSELAIGGGMLLMDSTATIGGSLSVGNTSIINSTLSTSKDTVINGTLTATEKSTVTINGSLTAGDTTIADSELSTKGGNATIRGSLDITNSTFNIDGSIKAGSASLTSAYLSSISDTTIDSTLDITNSSVSVGGNLKAGDTTLSGENSSLSTAIGSTNTIGKLTIKAGSVEINGSTTTATTVNQGTINNTGIWTINGVTTSTQGAITNTGSMKVAANLYSNTITGTDTGTGTISVQDKAAWYMYGKTELTTVENNGNIYVGYNGHLKADSLTGTGTTTIQVNNAIVSTDSAVIELKTNPIPEPDTEPDTDTNADPIKVEINLAHAASLVGKTVNFLFAGGELVEGELVGGALVGLKKDNITSTEATGWEENWKTEASKSYYSIQSGDNTVTKLEFTASEGSSADLATITGMTFNRFAESQKVDMNLTVPGTYQLTEIEVTTEIKVAEELTVTGVDSTIVSADDDVQAITITKTKGDNSDGNKEDVTVVFSKNVETTTGAAPTVKTTSITQNTTKKDADGNVIGNDSQILDVSGLTMVFDGTSSHKGNGKGNSKAEMGFKGNSDNTELGEVAIGTVTAKLEQVDIIEVKADSNVEVKDIDMASTHALTIEKGSVVTFENVGIQIGGATDASIVQTVDVIKYDENGEIMTDEYGKPDTVEHVMESASHLTTSTVIESATIKLLGNTTLTFEEIKFDDKGEVDPDLHGTTTITGSTVEISGGASLGANSTEAIGNEAAKNMQTISITDASEVSISESGKLINATLDGGSTISLSGGGTVTDTTLTGASMLLVQENSATVENVVVSNGSHLKGKGNLKKVHVDKDSTFTVGSSPGQFSAEDLTVNGVTNFYFITDSKEWDSKKPDEFTGTEAVGDGSDYDATTGTGDWGAISQLKVDGPVSLNGEVRFIYQKWDPTTNSFVNLTAEETQKAREELGEYFTEGTGVKFVLDDTNQLTLGSGFWINEDTLPVLADGLEWDVTSLFSSDHTAKVTYAMIGDPNRIANTLLSAGSTVLDFGRLGEAQAILREKGTTRTWGSAIANFDSIDSKDGATGYDYNAWGGAVGVDHAFTDRTVVGIALGRTYGENEAKEGMGDYEGGSIDQDATMVGLYGTHKFKTKGIMNDVKFSAFAAYGWFENESTRDSLKDNRTAEASWDSNAWVLSASLSRDITTDNDVVCSTYVGVEYTKATMDDFEESNGKSTASYTADEDYSNLAVKVGMTVSKSFGGFTPYVGIAYIHDVKRDVPEVTASSGRRSITGEGCMPGRGAVQIKAGANWQLSETLDIFAGYSAEIRDNATEHNANLGMGLTF